MGTTEADQEPALACCRFVPKVAHAVGQQKQTDCDEDRDEDGASRIQSLENVCSHPQICREVVKNKHGPANRESEIEEAMVKVTSIPRKWVLSAEDTSNERKERLEEW